MATPFGKLLALALKRSGMTQRTFAKAVGVSQGTLGNILSGQRRPPLHRIEAMVRALDLNGEEATAFLDAGYLAHSHEHVRRLVEHLRQQVAARR